MQAQNMAQLVQDLKRFGSLINSSVENAILKTDRKWYCRHNPYSDSAQDIGFGGTLSAPHMHVAALEILHDSIKYPVSQPVFLDIGSGSGYLLSAVSRMLNNQSKIYGIEHVADLAEKSKDNIKQDMDFSEEDLKNITVITADGRHCPQILCHDEIKFSAIHVGAAAEKIPEWLLKKLAPGGRMVIPVGKFDSTQFYYQIDKKLDGSVVKKSLFGVEYVPLCDVEFQLGVGRSLS